MHFGKTSQGEDMEVFSLLSSRLQVRITNYGARPTFENEEVRLETYLDGFDGDLYNRELKVEFIIVFKFL